MVQLGDEYLPCFLLSSDLPLIESHRGDDYQLANSCYEHRPPISFTQKIEGIGWFVDDVPSENLTDGSGNKASAPPSQDRRTNNSHKPKGEWSLLSQQRAQRHPR